MKPKRPSKVGEGAALCGEFAVGCVKRKNSQPLPQRASVALKRVMSSAAAGSADRVQGRTAEGVVSPPLPAHGVVAEGALRLLGSVIF